jgi:hypothetical protein
MLLDIIVIVGVAWGFFWLGGKYQGSWHTFGSAVMKKLEGK